MKEEVDKAPTRNIKSTRLIIVLISVTSPTEFYQITWKNDKKVQFAERVSDPSGTRLIGKAFLSNQFDAAVAFERTNKKKGTTAIELFKFDGKVRKLLFLCCYRCLYFNFSNILYLNLNAHFLQVVRISQIYPEAGTVRSKDPYGLINELFAIDNWCRD